MKILSKASCAGALGFVAVFALPTVQAQQAAAPVAASDQQLEKIEITGSSIKRVEGETALPVEVLTRDTIERMGITNAEQLVQNITSASGVGGTVTAQGAGQSTYGESTVSLRGLGSQRTLVLVNGRRLANFATDGTSVDINSIPVSAIDRIEILQDGASGVYGSDAVAGVINVILRKNYKGVQASAYLGTPTHSGGGQVDKVGLVAGFGDYDTDRYNLLLSFDAEHNNALYGASRSFATSSWDAQIYDTSATPSGAVQGPWILGAPLAAQTGLANGSIGYGNPVDNNCGSAGPLQQFDPNYGTCRFNPASFVPLVPLIDRQNVVGEFTLNIAPMTKGYAEVLYSHSKTQLTEQPSPYNVSFFTTDTAFSNPALNPNHVQPAVLIYPTNPNYSTIINWYNAGGNSNWGTLPTPNGSPYAVTYRAYDGGHRSHTDDASQIRLLAGITGTVGAWDYDTAVAFNSSRVEEDTTNGYQLMLPLLTVLNNPANGFNPWVYPQSPALAAQIAGTDYNGMVAKATLSTTDIDGKVSRALASMPGGALEFALGADLRHESISLNSSAPAQLGDISGYGNPIIPFSHGRNDEAIYTEFDAPLLKILEADLAVRYDHYESLASSTSPKISLRFQPIEQLVIRASAGKGFRAPSLPELYTPDFLATTAVIHDPGNGGQKNQYPNLIGGSTTLKPEKSTQDSLGFVLEPVKDLSVGLDYFSIRVSDTIGTLAPGDVLNLAFAGNPTYQAMVTRAQNGQLLQVTTLDTNLGTTSVAGWEANFRWKGSDWGIGRPGITLTGTYMSRYDVGQPDGSVQHSVAATAQVNSGNNGYNALTATQNGGIVMRWKHNLEVSLDNPNWSWSAIQHFQTDYWDLADNFGNAHLVPSFATYDTQLTYKGVKNLSVQIGVRNLFDTAPPVVAGTGIYFQGGYDPSYYDARMRFAYTNVTYKFK